MKRDKLTIEYYQRHLTEHEADQCRYRLNKKRDEPKNLLQMNEYDLLNKD